MKPLHNHVFTAMDITHVTDCIINEFKQQITEGMTDREIAAFNLGIKNTLDLIDQLIEQDENYIIPIIDHPTEEILLDELFEL